MERGHWRWFVVGLVALALPLGSVLAQGEGDPDRGGELYVENCAVCHGVEGQGRAGASLEAFSGIDVSASLSTIIAQGVEGSAMPAWAQANGGPLTQEDITDIVAYIVEAFQGTEPIHPLPTYQPPPITPLPDVSGDPVLGAVVYRQNCFACHGEEGRGRFGSPLAKSWPVTQPEVYILGVVRQGIPGTTMPAWAQANGGPLSMVDIENVTSYVLTLQPTGSAPTPQPEVEGPLDVTTTLIIVGVFGVGVVIALVLYYRRA